MTDGTTATFTVTNGGVNVVANPTGTASDSLTKIEIGETIYSVSGGSGGASSYTELDDKPTMNGHTIIGDMVSADLGLASASDIPDSLDDLSDDTNHRTVTDTEKTTWNGKADVSAIPTKTTDLTNDSGFITNTVNNLANYYTKSQTYSQSEVDALIAAAKNGRFIAVATLPATDIDTKAIYLVPSSDPEAGNLKDEYINTDGTSAGWELIGSTAIDLSGYVQKSQTAGLLKNDGTVNTTIEGAVSANTSAITAIKDGTNIDSFSDVESALGGKTDLDILAEEFSPHNIYAKGQLTIYNDELYIFTAYHDAGAWTGTDVTKIDVATALAYKADYSMVDAILDGQSIDSFGDVETALADKVDKVTGKGLSTNDYDNTEKAKVAGAFPRSEQRVLGAKNLIKNVHPVGSQTINGITFTVYSDGSVTANGTATAQAIFRLTSLTHSMSVEQPIPNGSYIVNGCNGGSNSTYFMNVRHQESNPPEITRLYDGEKTFQINGEGSVGCNIIVENGVTVNNVTFKPMIRLVTDTDPTYRPYAMTNEQLTNAVKNIPTVSVSHTGTASSTGVRKQQITVNNVAYDVDGSAYMEQEVILSTSGTTTVTFTNSIIADGKMLTFASSIWDLVPDAMVTTTGVCTVTLPKWTSAETIGCRLYVR